MYQKLENYQEMMRSNDKAKYEREQHKKGKKKL